MLLSLVLHMYSMRCVLPAAVMLGTAPTYVLAWGAWRLLSAFLPARVYQAVDDRLYCMYQSMVLFFFENYTGVQVRPCPPRARPPHLPSPPPGAAGARAALAAWAPPAPPGTSGSLPPRGRSAPEHVPSPHPPTSKSLHVLTFGFGPARPGTSHRVTEKLSDVVLGPRVGSAVPAPPL